MIKNQLTIRKILIELKVWLRKNNLDEKQLNAQAYPPKKRSITVELDNNILYSIIFSVL